MAGGGRQRKVAEHSEKDPGHWSAPGFAILAVGCARRGLFLSEGELEGEGTALAFFSFDLDVIAVRLEYAGDELKIKWIILRYSVCVHPCK